MRGNTQFFSGQVFYQKINRKWCVCSVVDFPLFHLSPVTAASISWPDNLWRCLCGKGSTSVPSHPAHVPRLWISFDIQACEWVPHSSASYSFHLRGYDSVVSMWNSQYLLGKEHSWGVEGWRLNSNTTAFAARAEDSSPVHCTHISELKTTCNSMPRNSVSIPASHRGACTRVACSHTHIHIK